MNHSTLANHWARMIEVVHCVEKIKELLHDPDLQGTDLRASGVRVLAFESGRTLLLEQDELAKLVKQHRVSLLTLNA